jgi:fibronectin type 3 domain-containing protein
MRPYASAVSRGHLSTGGGLNHCGTTAGPAETGARDRAHPLTKSARRASLAVVALALALAIGAGAAAVAAPTSTQAIACHESGEAGRLYTVTLCITSPDDGATLTGTAPVAATVTVNGTSPGVRRLVFHLGGQYLLTDFQAPYQFELPTQKFVDGQRTLEVEAWMRDGFITQRTTANVTFQNGVTTPPVNTNTFTPTTGTDPGAGPLVVGASGDGAGGDQSEADAVNLIAAWNPNLFLYLGDVYEKGTTTEFDNWYRPSNFYGRFRSITNPTIGNHEYENGQAPGYFDYWDNAPHFFSVDTHGWHLISLDTNPAFNQTAPGTAQYQWLVSDLQANTQPCTLVYYHQPFYNIGEEGSSTYLASIWSLLAQHNVDLVVNGHDHTYQRWQPLDGAGNPSPTGVTEIIAGTGGHALGSFITSDSRVVASAAEFGALRLDLNTGGATFQFVNTQGQLRDSGSVACDTSGTDTTPPSDPSGLTATATYKTNIDLSWNASSDNIGVTGYKIYRDGGHLTDVGPQLTYSDGNVLAGSTHTYTVKAIDAAQNESGHSNQATATTPTTGVLFHDGFESGDMSNWSQNAGLAVQSGHVFAGSFAARGTTSGSGGASALKQVPGTETNLYYVTRFKVLSKAASTTINLLRFRNNLAAANAIATVSLSATDRINLRNDVTGVTTTSTALAAGNTWHTLQVRVNINGASSQTEVWLDGVAIPALALSNVDLGTNPIGKLELGDPSTTKTYDVVYDEVAYDRELISDVSPPTAPTNVVATAHSGLRVDLTWTPATDDIGVTGYDVYRNDALIGSAPAGSTYADTTVAPHTSYTYKLKAKDGAGNLSDFSNTANASTGDVFADDFETGNLSKWTAVNGLNVQQQLVQGGQWAARATSAGAGGSSAQVTLDADVSGLYYRTRFYVAGQGANPVSLLRFRTSANAAIASVLVGSNGMLSYRNDTTATTVATSQAVTQNAWHELVAHVVVNGGSSQVELWLDGATVTTQTLTLGSTPIRRLELGDPSTTRVFDVAFDDVFVDTAVITSSDTIVPQPPTGLIPTVMSDTQINLVWTAGSDNVAVTSYRLYRNGSTTPILIDGSAKSYPDSGLAAGTTYTYVLTAVDAAGNESIASNTASATTTDSVAPQPPTGLTATSVLDTEIKLSWTAATDNVGVTAYQIYREDVATPYAELPGTATTYVDKPLAPQTSHTYTVYALDHAGHVSAASNAASATTPVFGDGFETGNLSRWSNNFGLVPDGVNFFAGLWGVQAQSNKSTVDYAVKQLPATFPTLYSRVRFKLLSGKPDTVDVLSLRTASGTPLLGLRYESKRRLSTINFVTGVSTVSTNALAAGTWYELKARLTVNAASQVEVWLNGTKIAALSKTDSFGTTPIGQIVIGEPLAGHDYNFAIDEVLVDTTP